jgi:hypothetical protein
MVKQKNGNVLICLENEGKIKSYFIRENPSHKFFWAAIAGGGCEVVWNCYSA